MKQTLLLLTFFFLSFVASAQRDSGPSCQNCFGNNAERSQIVIYPNPVTEFVGVNDDNEVVRRLDIFNLMQDRKMEESMIRIPFDDDMLKLANKAANIVSSDFLDFCVGAIRHHEEKVIEDESGEELNQGNGLPKAS